MSTTVMDGATLYHLLSNGYSNLMQNIDLINELNVFPVPDGDTGKNMTATLRGGLETATEDELSVGKMMKSFSRGSLMNARGNSGIILSQYIRGIAEYTKGKEKLTPLEFIEALDNGMKRAYTSVSKPTEGTMLTVMREGIHNESSVKESGDFEQCFQLLTDAFRTSLMNTPNLLPVLRDAGVVDSGGAGLLCVFEGMQSALLGEEIDSSSFQEESETMHFHSGDEPAVKVRKISAHTRYAVVAVATGQGIKDYFLGCGVSVIIEGGQTNNPSTKAFISAFEQLDADYIIVMPNDSNIILTANQAAQMYSHADVRVIPTSSIAEGYSALSMMDLSLDSIEKVVHEMTHYLPNVTTGYVTTATRDAKLNGIEIKQGHYIGLTQNCFYSDSTSIVDAAVTLFENLPNAQDKQVITVFCGSAVTDADKEEFYDRILSRYPLMEIGLLDGNQELYHMIMAIE